MSNDPAYAALVRELTGMNDLMKGMSEDLKAMSRQLAQFEQKHLHQDEQARENKAEIEKHDERLTLLERGADRQSGSLSTLRILGTLVFGVLATAVGWLLSVVLSTQSVTQIHQSKWPQMDNSISSMESRIQQLEQQQGRNR
ncbi:MAG: hypothetical protein VXW65_00365 [Pseudomonadota bacterium]|nr:hypothetical protein [Pseudomonadota bacterium]